MSERILSISDIATILSCSMPTARRLIAEMPRINLSPAGARCVRYGVRESDFERWLNRRTENKVVPEKRNRSDDHPLLQYRKKGG